MRFLGDLCAGDRSAVEAGHERASAHEHERVIGVAGEAMGAVWQGGASALSQVAADAEPSSWFVGQSWTLSALYERAGLVDSGRRFSQHAPSSHGLNQLGKDVACDPFHVQRCA